MLQPVQTHFSEFLEALPDFIAGKDPLEILKNHDVRDSTRKDYSYKIKHFQAFVEEHGFERTVLRDYKQHLKLDLKVVTTRSKNAYLAAAKVFIKRICKELQVNFSYFEEYKAFKVHKHHLRFGFTVEEVQNIQLSIDQIKDDFKRTRANALFRLMAFAGCRSIEAVSLQGQQIFLSENFALVHSKTTDEPRKIFLNSKVKEGLLPYREFIENHSGYWFTGLRGPKTEHLTTQAARNIFKPMFSKLGIYNKNLHGFRHYFTTSLLDAFNGDLLACMTFTGHSSVNGIRPYDDRRTEKTLFKKFDKVF